MFLDYTVYVHMFLLKNQLVWFAARRDTHNKIYHISLLFGDCRHALYTKSNYLMTTTNRNFYYLNKTVLRHNLRYLY